jgi:hypothetical protein
MNSALKFSRSGNVLGVFGGIIILGPSAFITIHGPTVHAETTRFRPSLLGVLDHATGGWLVFALCGAIFLFLFPHFVRAIWRSISTAQALAIERDGLVIHGSYTNLQDVVSLKRKFLVPFGDLESVALTTEGATMSGGWNNLGAFVTPLGANMLVSKLASKSANKVCLLISVKNFRRTNRSYKISAQFIDGGASALGTFHDALKSKTASCTD